MPKHTAAQREEIRNVVLELVLRGLSSEAICPFLSEKRGVSIVPRQVRRYMSEVKEEIRARARFDRDEQLGKSILLHEGLYRKFEQKKDLWGALAVRKHLDVVLGLIAHQDEHEGKMTFERWLRDAEKSAEERTGKGENGKRDGAKLPVPLGTA